LLVSSGLEALPGQATSKEVEENMAQGLQVVSSRLLCESSGISDTSLDVQLCAYLDPDGC
jgi:hypothetical protein